MWNMKSLQWAELFLTTSHLSSSSWSKLVRDNFAEKLWCCCRGSARLEPGLVWGCRGWSLPQHFLQTIRGVRTEACHRVRIQQLLHNLMKMDVLQGHGSKIHRKGQKMGKKGRQLFQIWGGISLTHFLALFPAPLSRKPLANGLLSIFSWVI